MAYHSTRESQTAIPRKSIKVKISGNVEITEKYVLIDGCIYLQLNLINKW